MSWTEGIQSNGSISAASEMIPMTTSATTARKRMSAMQPPPAVSLSELEAIATRLVEDVLEAGAVAEPAELDAHRRAVRAVLGARHEHDVGEPAARVRSAREVRAAAASDCGRVLVAVHARPRRAAAEQAFAPGVGAGSVEDEHAGPATVQRALDVGPDVRVLRGAEPDRHDATRARAASRGTTARSSGLAASAPCLALRARARQRLAVAAVAVGVARVLRTLRGRLVRVAATRCGLRRRDVEGMARGGAD